MKKEARKVDHRRLSGLGWFFGCPMPAFSSLQIARIFEGFWTLPEAEMHIRLAVKSGELHAFREHTVNLFERGEVIAFIARYHPATPDEMASAIVQSGYRDACVPAVFLVRMLEAAKAGKIMYALALTRPPLSELRWDDEPTLGSIANPKYPPPHTPRVGSARPDLSNELPHLRTRIRRGSAKRT